MRRLEGEFAAELALVRPELSARYAEALPGARAAVMGRLWRGLLYEPLPGLTVTGPSRVLLADGRELTGPERRPYDLGDEPVLRLDGHAHTHPAALLAALGLPGADRLVEDLDNSVASMALSRAGAAPPVGAALEDHEQSVIDGHPYHPGCRNRPGVSVAEQLAYMPEHRPTVALDLLALPLRDCLVTGPWPASLVDGDRLLLPIHPWQTTHVLPALGLRPHATGAVRARPLMSVRTLAPLDGGPHLKTAFTTRMTSGVRDISPGSVRDCVPLSSLLTTLAARCGGGLRIARYLAGAAGPVDGEHSADLSCMLREPTPERGPVLPVAAVTAAMAPDPAAWLTAFARLVLRDTLGLLSLGVALEAHGQNLLVALGRDGLPYRLIYRDLADVRISPGRLARNGIEPPPVSARLLSDDPAVLHAKLFGSLAGTTFGSLIALFGQGDRAVEGRLWAIVAAAAREAFGALPDTRDVRADRDALLGERIAVKAHLVARLDGAPAGDSWTSLPNFLNDRKHT
ncbi:IucA/IucC family siderophore biosynthesis protein [Nonomuraea sp. PA05]|uniref:IucA/IucC family protein n=1 Tax=Nonomuraea sp. PA05 TaxID=2604466 RepID=UPI0011DA9BD8|nr:IucA/IucC family siderophore biosynthesis protein [Nonomuraea sp. PA05]TYB59195.1 IucA/IucC family siderophore biosynthesis protein [Nonomuraea sp. PA05]